MICSTISGMINRRMEDREEAMKYIEEHGSLLYKYNRGLILEMVISYLEIQKKSRNGFKPFKFISIFQNIDEVWAFKETEELVQYCYRNFSIIAENKKEVAHFIVNYYTFILKKTRSENIEKYFAADKKMNELLDDEAFIRVTDTHYLVILFSAVELKEKKIKLLEISGRRYEVIKEYFKDGKITEAHKFCNKNVKDPELPILLLQLVCNATIDDHDISKYNTYISELLNLIKIQEGFHPHFVLKILKKCKFLELKFIKAYLNNIIEKKIENIHNTEDDIEKNEILISEKKGKLVTLETKAFMCQPTTCSLCHAKLSNPSIFFMCGHSYHTTCVEEKDCPHCVDL
jgi:hypothetical protein